MKNFRSMFLCHAHVHRAHRRFFHALLAAFAFSVSGGPMSTVQAETFSVTLGGENGWTALASSEGLTETTGRFALPALGLTPSGDFEGRNRTRENDELYLSFDTPEFQDATERYRVMSSNLRFSTPELARQGTGAALCNTTGEGLVLRGNPGAIFSERGEMPSFTIQFWLYPSVTETGGTVFSWRSSVLTRDVRTHPLLYQSIRAVFEKNRLVWEFSDIWMTESGTPLKVKLEPTAMLVPRQWSLHQVSYDSLAGTLEYRVNGLTEAVVYVTEDGSFRGTPAAAFIGNPADIDIASRYSGLIDEFTITREPLPEMTVSDTRTVSGRYPAEGGAFTSSPIDTGRGTSSLVSADISVIEPEGTESEFYVRGGDNFYTWTDESPEWIPLIDGKPTADVSGRYFQISGGLYPDGERKAGPLLTWISLHFERKNEPWPPLNIRGNAGDKKVTLSWNAPADSGTKGYVVYYGEGSGEYLSPSSPIDTGDALSCTISGLENGKMYYFCVASYGEAGKDFPGPSSPEICLRPLATRTGMGD